MPTNTSIALYGTVEDMRRQVANVAVLALIEESCFLSPEALRHELCRDIARELVGWQDEYGPSAMADAIRRHPTFAMDFYCRGAAHVCGRCGAVVAPGHKACPDCTSPIEHQDILLRPAWETRLVTKGLEVAITTSLAADGLVMVTLHRTTRLFALRNLLNHSAKADWQLRTKHIRAAILDAWPEGKKPEHDSWEVRWLRESATFWVLVWPHLAAYLTLEQVDALNTRFIRAITASAVKWTTAGGDMDLFARLVDGVLKLDGVDKVAALAALRPDGMAGDADRAAGKGKQSVLQPAELLRRGELVETFPGGAALVIELDEAEVALLETGYGIKMGDPGAIAQLFVAQG